MSVELAPGAGGTSGGVDVVAIVASAGGLGAIETVLRALPDDLPAAVVVAQHLGTGPSSLVPILRERSALPVEWADEATVLQPGTVTVCPPRTAIEVLPDRSVALTPVELADSSRSFDLALSSVAKSFGRRATGVVLTGMGHDGSAGARALHRAGGTVVVQSPESAEHPSMPRAVLDAGAVDLVLPLVDIGPAITQLVTGRSDAADGQRSSRKPVAPRPAHHADR